MHVSFGEYFRFGESSSELRTPAPWSEFLFKLGQSMAASPNNSNFIVILPTLKLAAPLIGSGFLHQQFNSKKSTAVNDNLFERFRKLEKGARLNFQTQNGEQIAAFECITDYKGQECISIKVQSEKKGAGKQILTKDRLHQVTIISEQPGNVADKNIGKGVSNFPLELKKLYGLDGLHDFSDLNYKLQIFTRLIEFREEQEFNIYKTSKEKVPLQFKDLLRCDIEKQIEPPIFTNLIANANSDPIIFSDTQSLVIFRGAQGYLRNHHSIQNSRQILILDYSDIHLNDAIAIFNQNYLHRLEEIQLLDLQIPEGVILSGFSK